MKKNIDLYKKKKIEEKKGLTKNFYFSVSPFSIKKTLPLRPIWI